jgi:hypothetical protein
MCGFWALKTEAQAVEIAIAHLARCVFWGAGGRRVVVGQVQLWGRVIEHKDGYRSQFARPYALTVLGDEPGDAEALRTRYGCEAAVVAKGDLISEQALELRRKLELSRIEDLRARYALPVSAQPQHPRRSRFLRWLWPVQLLTNLILLPFTRSLITLVVVVVSLAFTVWLWRPRKEDT